MAASIENVALFDKMATLIGNAIYIFNSTTKKRRVIIDVKYSETCP